MCAGSPPRLNPEPLRSECSVLLWGFCLPPDAQPWPLQIEHLPQPPLTGAALLSDVSETFPHTGTCDLFSLAPER